MKSATSFTVTTVEQSGLIIKFSQKYRSPNHTSSESYERISNFGLSVLTVAEGIAGPWRHAAILE